MPSPARLAALLLVTASIAAAQSVKPPSSDELEKQLRDRIAAFDQARAKLDVKALAAFDKAVQIARTNPRIKEAVRQDFIDKATAAKARYEKTRRWPDDHLLGLLDDEYAYAVQLSQAYAPVSTAYDKLLKAYRAANDDMGVARTLAARAGTADAFPGRDGFTSGSTWSGLASGKSKYDLRLRQVRDAVFEGVMHMNPQNVGHPVYEVAGSIEGNRVVFVKSKQVEGNGGPGNFSGYLSAGRLFLFIGKGGAYVVMERTGGPRKK